MKLLKFGAPWCAGCRTLTETMKDLETTIPIEEIDCDEDEYSLCAKYKVRSIPLLVLIDDNEEVLRRIPGSVSLEVIKEMLKQFETKPEE
jgi:thioredoxin-like negative regulator of GroEL